MFTLFSALPPHHPQYNQYIQHQQHQFNYQAPQSSLQDELVRMNVFVEKEMGLDSLPYKLKFHFI